MRARQPVLSRRVGFRTKQELVHRALREAILRCELAPGTRIVIEDVARRLEVSAVPVREALQLLQSEGLVESVPHVGATVSAISRESIDELFAIMEGLEGVATRAAARHLRPEHADELKRLVEEMDTVAEDAGRVADWGDLNTRFHLAICRAAAMPLLLEMTERALARWDRVRRYYFNGVLAHRVARAQLEHRLLLRALLEGDADGVESLVQQHNRGALRAYTEYLDSSAT